MNRKAVSGLMFTLLLISMLTLTSNIQPVKAGPTTIIVPDDYPTIQEAINNADEGDRIFVLSGTYYENVIVNKTVSLVGEDAETTIIDGNHAWEVVSIEADYTEITGFTIRNIGFGIHVTSNGNSITDNMITNNWFGIFVVGSSGNNITDNNITANGFSGIKIEFSSDNHISGNNITNNGDGWDAGGIVAGACSNTTICQNDITANNRYGIVILWHPSEYNRIFGNNIKGNDYGIYLGDSLSDSISGNNIVNNTHGIGLTFSSSNTISENMIANNTDGIYLHSSDDNGFCHNSFINNTNQVYVYDQVSNIWDDGYPSGGNYWSDYEERYPNATEIGGSGIWDTPYVIDETNQDNYPLMEPWTPTPPVPTTIDELKTETEELGLQGEIDNQGIVKSLIVKLNVAQKLIDDGKIDQAKNILNAFINEAQAQSRKHITPEAAELLIESAEYILSHLTR